MADPGGTSLYPTLYDPAAQTAADVGSHAAEASSAFVSSMVTPLLLAAGSASSVPVAGWVVAGVAATAAAVAQLVSAVTAGKIRRDEAVEWARNLGLPDPDGVPHFVVKVQGLSLTGRLRLAEALHREKMGGVRARRGRKIETELGIILALLQIDGVMRQAAVSGPSPPRDYNARPYYVSALATVVPEDPRTVALVGLTAVGLLLMLGYAASAR